MPPQFWSRTAQFYNFNQSWNGHHTFIVLLQKQISWFMTSVLFCSVDNLEYHGHTIWLLNWRCFLTGFLEKISRYYPLWTLLISWNLFVMSHYFASYVSKTTISLQYEWVKLCWISVFICNLFSLSPCIMHSVYVFTDFVLGFWLTVSDPWVS